MQGKYFASFTDLLSLNEAQHFQGSDFLDRANLWNVVLVAAVGLFSECAVSFSNFNYNFGQNNGHFVAEIWMLVC